MFSCTCRIKWRLVIVTLFVLLLGATIYLIYRYNNPKAILFTEQYTYTMKDDQEVYLLRTPKVYVESFLPNVRFYPESLHKIFANLTEDSSLHWMELTRRYNFHLNLDYTVQLEEGYLIVTYMGFGKLRDGTVESIDIQDKYPIFYYEDHTANAWDLPDSPFVVRILDLQDPSHVIDPPWPEDSSEWPGRE